MLEVFEKKWFAIRSLSISIMIWMVLAVLLYNLTHYGTDAFLFHLLLFIGISISSFINCKNAIARLRENRPLYIFYENGIEDWQSSLGLIEWEDISNLRYSKNCLHFTITDLKKYLKRPFAINHIKADKKAGDHLDVTIDFGKMNCKASDAFHFIKAHKNEFQLPLDKFISE